MCNTPNEPKFDSPEAMIQYLEKRYFVIHKRGMAIWSLILAAAVTVAAGVTIRQVPVAARDEANAVILSEMDDVRVTASHIVESEILRQTQPLKDRLYADLKPKVEHAAMDTVRTWAQDTGSKSLINQLTLLEGQATALRNNIDNIDPQAIVALTEQPRLIAAGEINTNGNYAQDPIGETVTIEQKRENNSPIDGEYSIELEHLRDQYGTPYMIATPAVNASYSIRVRRNTQAGLYSFQVSMRNHENEPEHSGFMYAIFAVPKAADVENNSEGTPG